jgi:citrate synthase
MTYPIILTADNQTFTLPARAAMLGPAVFEIAPLLKCQPQRFTYDPGFAATAACASRITYIDGDQGILLYRGYPIEQLAEKTDYLTVCYLLLKGELPTDKEKHSFIEALAVQRVLNNTLKDTLRGFSTDAHPMAMMISLMGALAAYHYEDFDVRDPEHRNKVVLRLIALMPVLAAQCYHYTQGTDLKYPENWSGFLNKPPEDQDAYASDFLQMMFGMCPDPAAVRALSRIFILHADHEQNASTSTVRLAGSTGANPYACISAGLAALWGAAHGGANEACLKMLIEIGSPDNISKYLARAKDRNDPFRLMGFGHRLYKTCDPRASVMRQSCHEVLAALGRKEEPLFKLALQLEQVALEDQYFISRKLYPNVDFYSGIILNALGVPTRMFTVMFALARTVGWIAHWLEMIHDPESRLGRPRQLYLGSVKRDYPTETSV